LESGSLPRIRHCGTRSALAAEPAAKRPARITSTSGYTYDIPSSVLWTSIAATGAVGIGQGGVLGMPRADGISDGVNLIQGVRTYDGNSGQWTTPDVYPAMPGNPWSGKKYLWNNGNPLSNSDPSGFDPNNPFSSGVSAVLTGSTACPKLLIRTVTS
jgi:hypothetical protein